MLGINPVARLSEDLRVIYQLLRPRPSSGSLQDRLEEFYRDQAGLYDNFRERLLPGRRELVERVIPKGFSGVWIDVGGGTGRTIEYVCKRMSDHARVIVLDLCPSLLEQARSRIQREKWHFAEALAGDVNDASQLFAQADVVTFSYSLTMIPDWRSALVNAGKMLKPNGVLGIVDFTCDDQQSPALKRMRGALWKKWFSHDGVYLSEFHLAAAKRQFCTEYAEVRSTPIPYVPGMRVPYYMFCGRAPGN